MRGVLVARSHSTLTTSWKWNFYFCQSLDMFNMLQASGQVMDLSSDSTPLPTSKNAAPGVETLLFNVRNWLPPWKGSVHIMLSVYVIPPKTFIFGELPKAIKLPFLSALVSA